MNIKEFARLAGVSISTVSKIMNNKDNDISPETRNHVLKLASEYNYRPYSFVLSSHSTSAVNGIIFNTPSELSSLQQGMLESFSVNSYSTLLKFARNSSEGFRQNLISMMELKLSNIIHSSKQDLSKSDIDHSKNTKIFSLLSDFKLDITFYNLAYKMCNEFINLKHKKIALVFKKDLFFDNFLSGYKTCLFDNNLPFNKDLIYNFSDKNICNKILTDFLNNKFSSILVYDYYTALELYNLFKDMGYQIPGDLSFLCVRDNIDMELKDTPTTTILSYVNVPFFSYGKAIGDFISGLNSCDSLSQPFNFEFNTEISSNISISKPFSSNAPVILSIGSINIDNYMTFQTLPHTGKASISNSANLYPGGKALNQAIASAKLGNKTYIIGQVGYDSDSNYILSELNKYKIITRGVSRNKNTKTGQAYIFVQSDGDSIITIMSGANNYLSSKDIIKNEEIFAKSNCCLLQTEIPLESVITSAKLAKKHNCLVFLKPSTCSSLPQELLDNIDFLVPNIIELNELVTDDISFKDKARYFIAKGVKNVIVTMGADGAYIFNNEFEEYITTERVPSIDSSGAGDAFISTLATYTLHSYDIKTGVKIANIAAGISTLKQGVAPSLPTKVELEYRLEKLNLLNH